jgi:hypothetical protein
MRTDWRSLARGPDATLDSNGVTVRFPSGRTHHVRVTETDDTFELTAIVARAAAINDVRDLAIRIWRHNRAAQLVSFRLDAGGRIIGACWVPKAGVSAEEFQLVLRRVASESDRLEFLLTGRDIE